MTGIDQPVTAIKGKHCMVSFANPEQIQIAVKYCQTYTLDNGAFSLWKKEEKLDLDKLAEWIGEWSRYPNCDWYCLPDVIGGSHDDNALLRSKWFNKVGPDVWRKGSPVWHFHEPLEVLRDFIKFGAPCVCLGSSAEYSQVGTRFWWARMAEAMQVLCDDEGFPKVKIHGLRMLDSQIFGQLPLYSADSTNAARRIGFDQDWKGVYSPSNKKLRAAVMMDRIESNHAALKWCKQVKIQSDLFF